VNEPEPEGRTLWIGLVGWLGVAQGRVVTGEVLQGLRLARGERVCYRARFAEPLGEEWLSRETPENTGG
jgi:hypothetical protein